MSEGVLIALITAGQAVTLGLITVVGARLGKVRTELGKVKTDAAAARTHSAAARYQVENDHTENLREENDSRHAETKRWFDALSATVTRQNATITRDIGGLREEIRIDRHATAQRFHLIENRITKEP